MGHPLPRIGHGKHPGSRRKPRERGAGFAPSRVAPAPSRVAPKVIERASARAKGGAGTIRADAAHRPRGPSNDRLGVYPCQQDLERTSRRLAEGCLRHFPEGIGPLRDQGIHRPAVLGRGAGQDAKPAFARHARALDCECCGGRCFRHVPGQLHTFRDGALRSLFPAPALSERRHGSLARAAYSITSSVRASTLAGISMPSAFAVLRLITRSNLVGR